MSIKQDFIDAIRATPEGIASFLSTAIPTLAATNLPTDKDSSILTQGILAHNLNTILMLFVGLTPVEMVLRVGQHSNVSEALLLSCLEYIQESESQKDFTIDEPAGGKSYKPGDLRLIASSTSSHIKTLTVQVTRGSGIEPLSVELQPDYQGKKFFGFARCPDEGEVSLSFAATFNDKDATIKTKSISVTISATATDQAGGADKTAFDTSVSLFESAYIAAMKLIDGGTMTVGNDQLRGVADTANGVKNAASGVSQTILDAISRAIDDMLI
jgi:hypothetical protein